MQNKKGDKSHFLLTFEVVEELGDLLQIAELQPGEARAGLSLAEKPLDVTLDVREHLPDVLQVVAAVGDAEADGVLALGDLASDAEEADEVHAGVGAVDHDAEVAEDDLVVFEELAAAVVELELPGVVSEVRREERRLLRVLREGDVVGADAEVEAVDGGEEA